MSQKSLWVGIVIGAVAGAAIGYLTAPKTGREMREDMKQRADLVAEKAGQAFHDLKKAACGDNHPAS